jgi:hypothetical protein
MRTSYVVTDSYSTARCGVVGLGVAFRGGRIICGEIAEAPDLLGAELLAILRAVEISSKVTGVQTVVYSDHEDAVTMVNLGGWRSYVVVAEIRRLLRACEGAIVVEFAPKGVVKAARLVARQTFKAWRCASTTGVTWGPEGGENGAGEIHWQTSPPGAASTSTEPKPRPDGCICPFPDEPGFVCRDCPVHDPAGTYHDDPASTSADPQGGDRAGTGHGSSATESADVAEAASGGSGAASLNLSFSDARLQGGHHFERLRRTFGFDHRDEPGGLV